MKNRLLLIMSALVLSVGTTYGATAAKGVFTVNADGKTVQFANANSVYSEKELIQWSHLQDAIEAGWDVLTGAAGYAGGLEDQQRTWCCFTIWLPSHCRCFLLSL